MNWLQTLSEEQKQSVFAAMRKIGERINRACETEKKLRAPYGSIAFGSGQFDPLLDAETLSEFLRAIRNGETPADAKVKAMAYSREMIAKHNQKRAPELGWQRWEGHGDSKIEQACLMIEVAANKAAQ